MIVFRVPQTACFLLEDATYAWTAGQQYVELCYHPPRGAYQDLGGAVISALFWFKQIVGSSRVALESRWRAKNAKNKQGLRVPASPLGRKVKYR
jgi:hypothetical protein